MISAHSAVTLRDLPRSIAAPPTTNSLAVNLFTISIGVCVDVRASTLCPGIEVAHVPERVKCLGRRDPLSRGIAVEGLEPRLDVLLEFGSGVGVRATALTSRSWAW